MFHVVDFKGCRKRTVVPDTWLNINDTLCLLPPKVSDQELEVLAKNRVEPSEGWQIYGVSSLLTFESYSDAIKRLEELKDTSKADDHQRKRKKPTYLADYHVLDSGVDQPSYTVFETVQDEEDESENEWDPSPSSQFVPRVNKVLEASQVDDHQRKRKKPSYLADNHVLNSGHDQPLYTDFGTMQEEEDESENEWDPTPSPQFVPRIGKVSCERRIHNQGNKRIVQFNHSRHHPRQNVEVKCACKSTCHGTILLALKNMQKQLDRTNQMVQHLLMGRPKPMQFQPKRAFFRKSTNRKRSREENESQLKEDANFFQSNRDKTAAQNRTETPTFTAAEVVYITKDRHQISEADILENIDVRKWLMSYPKGRELMLKLDSEIFFPKDRQLLVRLVCKKLVEQCGNAVLDVPQPDTLSLTSQSSLDEELCCSTPTSFSVFEASPILDEFSQRIDHKDFPFRYKLPQFPLWVQTLLQTRSPLCKESKCRRAIIDTLFNDLLRYGYYPQSRVFQETSRALVEAHPILKDKQLANAEPHDSWVIRIRDKFKKYRSRHAELCEDVEKMKVKFGRKKNRTQLPIENDSLTSVKRLKVPKSSECAEDQFSTNVHLKVIQDECKKQKPDADLIKDKMMRTFQYRVKYVTTHSVAETLMCFPALQQTNELLNEATRLGISRTLLREFLILKKKRLSQLAQKRKQTNEKLSQLLKAKEESTYIEESELAYIMLLLPCLLQENFPFLYLDESTEISVLEPIIIHRNSSNVFKNSCYELFLDKQLVTKSDDLVTAITLWFTVFWLFDVGYNKNHKKLLSFLDTFVFRKCSITQIPQSVKTLFNAL